MYLQKLEIQGFKSFAAKTTLEFNQKLTAIVGPNGSGKSNIADAIRWVLGEQSIKLLRGKKSEDVIFAGSDLKTRGGMAEVSLYLNNEDGTADVDYSEIVITRRIYRNGESEYLLNGSPVRLTDINLLLARANFGQKSYSVIGQGMIDSILLSSPADRKEFFEEATGIKQFQIKREQSINKLLTTYDNLEQVELVLNEIEPRLKTLTRQVKKLEQRDEMEKDLLELQKNYYSFRYHQLMSQHDVVAKDHDALNKQTTTLKDKIKTLSIKIKDLEQGEMLPASYLQLKNKLDDARTQLNKLLKEKTLLQAQDELEHIKRGEGEIVWLNRRLEDLGNEIKNLTEQRNANTKTSQQLNNQLDSKIKEQSLIAHEFNRGFSEKEITVEVKREITSLSEEYDNWLSKIKLAHSPKELQPLLEQGERLGNSLRKIVKNFNAGLSQENWQNAFKKQEELVHDIASYKAKISALDEQMVELNNRLQKLTGEKNHIEKSLANQQSFAQAGNIEKEIDVNQETVVNLEKELASFHESVEVKKQEFFNLQNSINGLSSELHSLEQNQHELALQITKIDTKKEDLENEMSKEVPAELSHVIKEAKSSTNINEGELALEIQKLKKQLEVTGGIDPEVIAEYQKTKERHDFLSTQEGDLRQAINSLEVIIKELDETITKQFLNSFKTINEKFGKYFEVLFNGGRASLNLQKTVINTKPAEDDDLDEDDEDDDEEENDDQPTSKIAKEKLLLQQKLQASMFSGVDIVATPPGKKLSSITALSGGEKALTSIALICSIISHLPSPFVVLDEVDAALDEANSERFAAILDSLIDKTQFITITHNRATMKRSSILYGVTMGDDGVSRLLSVKLEQANEMVRN